MTNSMGNRDYGGSSSATAVSEGLQWHAEVAGCLPVLDMILSQWQPCSCIQHALALSQLKQPLAKH